VVVGVAALRAKCDAGALSDDVTNVIDAKRTITDPKITHAHHTR